MIYTCSKQDVGQILGYHHIISGSLSKLLVYTKLG